MKKVLIKRILLISTLALVLVLTGTQAVFAIGSGWAIIDGSGDQGLNSDVSLNASWQESAVLESNIYVAFIEDSKIRVKKYDGTSWTFVDGGGRNRNGQNADSVGITSFDGNIYVIWSQSGDSKICVDAYDGTTWTPVDGGQINNEAGLPLGGTALGIYNGKLYATWVQAKNVRVRRYDGGTTWVTVDGGGLNFDASKQSSFPSLIEYNGNMAAAWQENGANGKMQMCVKMYDGASWPVALQWSSLNVDPEINAYYPSSLAVYDNKLYLTWYGSDLKVVTKEYDGTSWSINDGGSSPNLNDNPTSSVNRLGSFADANGLYIAFNESGILRIKKFDGTTWFFIDNNDPVGLNYSVFSSPDSMSIISMNGELFAFWPEMNYTWSSMIRAAKFTPMDLTPSQSLNRSNLDSSTIDVQFSGTTFIDANFDTNNFMLVNAPPGVTVENVDYLTDTSCTVDLAFDGTVFEDDIANLRLIIKGAELSFGCDMISRNQLPIDAQASSENIINVSPLEDNYTDDWGSIYGGGSFDRNAEKVNYVGCDVNNFILFQNSAIKFDLSDVDSTVIEQAYLKIFVDDINGNPLLTLNSATDDSWTEGGSFPSTTGQAVINSYQDIPVSAGGWMIFNVTEFVYAEAESDGMATFVITGLEDDGFNSFGFISDENSHSQPKLTIIKKQTSLAAKALTADTTNNSVDYDIEITFGADVAFESAITGLSFNGTALTVTTDYVVSSGKVTLKPGGGNAALQTPATGDVEITATGYNDSTISQTITAGAAATLTVTQQPIPGAASGDSFATQPVITLKDQYGNTCTDGPSASADVVAAAKAGTGTWTIGGTTTKAASAGVATFTDLTCSLTSSGNGAVTFTSGVVTADSNPFTIPMKAAKVLTADTTNNSVDYDIEITFGADADFEAAITGVSFNGTVLTATTDYVVSSGKVTLKPGGGNAALQTPATGDVEITATGYNDSTVAQIIYHGAAVTMEVTQNITAPETNGGTFAQQPIITIKDVFGNTCTNDNTTEVTVSKKDEGTWTLTGTTTVTAVYGVTTFTGLGATNSSRVVNAQLAFNSEGISEITSSMVTLPAPPSSGGSITVNANTGAEILVNGKPESAGTAMTATVGNQTVTTITVDAQKLEAKLQSEGRNAVVTIPVNTNADVFRGELNGQMIKNMESMQAVVEVKTENVTYTLPAQEINIDSVSAIIGQNLNLSDIKVSIELAKSPEQTVKVVEDSASKGNFAIVVPPVDFTVKCSFDNKTVEVSKYNNYVERTVAIPDGVDPAKITTGIVVEPDGTVRHVPTKVIIINGKYYAQINSLTNSTYSVIWYPREFTDVENHWAREAVNDMGSRMVISGVGNDMFEPGRDITRAEFAAIMVRALGLKPGTANEIFSDVKATEWYGGYIETAYEYGIISGYGNGKFGPNDKITREQAMAMTARAMKITGLKVELADGELDKTLAAFTDSGSAADYAKPAIAACVKTGIVSGKGNNLAAPKDNITRAEVAVIVRGLLQKSELI